MISLLCNNIPIFHFFSRMVTNGPMGLVKGFCLGALCFTPCHFWYFDGVLLAISIIALSWARLPLLPLHATSFIGSFNCGLGILSFVGLPFFINGGFCFAGLSFASCTFSFSLLSLVTWATTSFVGVPMIA